MLFFTTVCMEAFASLVPKGISLPCSLDSSGSSLLQTTRKCPICREDIKAVSELNETEKDQTPVGKIVAQIPRKQRTKTQEADIARVAARWNS